MLRPDVFINLARIRQNAEAILKHTRVPLIAVVKSDAYGLGATEVAQTIGDLVDAFYVFDAAEAVTARLWDIAGKRIVALNTCDDVTELISQHIQPVVWSSRRATQMQRARPVLSIDTGQQRFACPVKSAFDVLKSGGCEEAMTHAINLSQVQTMLDAVRPWKSQLFLHAAGSALLNEPQAWLNAVRPGLALYQGAVEVCTRLVDVRDSTGPAGYTGFISPRFGIILAGYSQGLRRGGCQINGIVREVLEVGMQSSFVECGVGDKIGDQVQLLGDHPEIDLESVSRAWGTSRQEALVRLTLLGSKNYSRYADR